MICDRDASLLDRIEDSGAVDRANVGRPTKNVE
jgi:hypothetical protein